MNTKIMTDVAGLKSIQQDWERLEGQNPSLSYYSTFRYNYAWWLAHGHDPKLKLFIICCYKDSVLVGIAPLMIRRNEKRIFNFHVLCFLGQGDYLDFIVGSNGSSVQLIIKHLFKAILEHEGQWDKISLTHLCMQSALLHYLLRSDTYHAHVEYLTSCPRLNMEQFSSFEQLSQHIFNTKLLKKIEKMKKQIPYRLRVVHGDESEEILDRIASIHKMEKEYLLEQKGRSERKSIFDDPANHDFLKRLFKNNEQVVIFMLEAEDGDTIIYSCCYMHGNVSYNWNTGYSPRYSSIHGIVDVLQYEIFKYMYETKHAMNIDLGAGSYPWKFKWVNQFVVNYSFTYWNHSSFNSRLIRTLVKARRILRYARGADHAH
ncbi:hypothetical protein JCM10914A_09890 [Paenibacillus sp. JCM 10914]|uniref:GNAT family N-acetyltransferase n=1 Tax=Paenibacillus sp. JCM 10914 TaxID=1236974 RepID=UPI0003CC3CCF|nr:GNAT family N-acetyltransferase [Paenibacillus sp. JCM 10914]GAE07321.1 cellulose biosynthesis protein [Paenibacillus sp. JCM 10914]